jgi:hypothetical protein
MAVKSLLAAMQCEDWTGSEVVYAVQGGDPGNFPGVDRMTMVRSRDWLLVPSLWSNPCHSSEALAR